MRQDFTIADRTFTLHRSFVNGKEKITHGDRILSEGGAIAGLSRRVSTHRFRFEGSDYEVHIRAGGITAAVNGQPQPVSTPPVQFSLVAWTAIFVLIPIAGIAYETYVFVTSKGGGFSTGGYIGILVGICIWMGIGAANLYRNMRGSRGPAVNR